MVLLRNVMLLIKKLFEVNSYTHVVVKCVLSKLCTMPHCYTFMIQSLLQQYSVIDSITKAENKTVLLKINCSSSLLVPLLARYIVLHC